MRRGSGEAAVAVAREAAFRYLSDPRNAPEWFAGVQFPEQPEGSPRAGMIWRFVQARSDNRVIPVRMEVYEPPTRFVWRTALHWPRTNLRWEMTCVADGAPDAVSTRLRMTIGIEPGPVGWLGLWISPRAYRPDPALQAQRAVERARDTLLEQASPSAAKSREKRGRRRR
jgi:hypothetical protein